MDGLNAENGDLAAGQGPRKKKRGSRITDPFWTEKRFIELTEAEDDHLDVDDQLIHLITQIEERSGKFNWRVFLMTASGFLTDSYNLFASNVILPSLAFVYFYSKDSDSQAKQIAINAVTLAGSAIGQVFFGIFADRYGRQKLYGIELIIVVFSTIGLAQSAYGFQASNHVTSMELSGWLIVWRFITGLGIGAEYPLSACIAAEWSPKATRGRMMALVFSMQALGQVFAYGVGWSVLVGLSHYELYHGFLTDDDNARLGVDILWRIVTGVGSFPAVVAIVFRMLLPETGCYTFGVKKQYRKAVADNTRGLKTLFSSLRKWWTSSFIWAPPVMDDAETHEMMEDGQAYNATQRPDITNPRSQDASRHGAHPRSQSSHKDKQATEPVGQRPFMSVENGRGPLDDEISIACEQQDVIRNESCETVAQSGSSQQDNAEQYPFPDDDRHSESSQRPQRMQRQPGSKDKENQHPVLRQFNYDELKEYFWNGGNWRHLAGTALCWFCLDFAFFGLGFNNPGTLAKLWTQNNITNIQLAKAPSWLLDSSAIEGNGTIFNVLWSNAKESIITVCIGSILGSMTIIYYIDKIDRRKLLYRSFLVLATMLLITGLAFNRLFHHPGLNVILIILYGLIQFVFSVGPNTLTFIVAAEVFPEKYRCTCHGLSAAAGKIGAVLVQALFLTYHDRREDEGCPTRLPALGCPNSPAFGQIMILFAAFMLLGAVSAWVWVPPVQRVEKVDVSQSADALQGAKVFSLQLVTMSLEDLGRGREASPWHERTGVTIRLRVLWYQWKGVEFEDDAPPIPIIDYEWWRGQRLRRRDDSAEGRRARSLRYANGGPAL